MNITTKDEDLTDVLASLGVDIRRVSGDEINGRCPVHHLVKGRASERYSWYINIDSGLWHCFTCGARGNLSHLVSQLSGDPSVLWSVQSKLIDSGLRRITADEQEIVEEHPRIDWHKIMEHPPLPERILDRRGLAPEVAQRYGVRWDTELKAILLPIVSPVGELWGWQQKKTGWVRNYPVGIHKASTLFGIERAHAPTGILVESPLDVVRFHSVYDGDEYSMVASFGANVSKEQVTLLSLRFDKLVLALDNDDAGRYETRRIMKALPSFKGGCYFWQYSANVKDIGDLTDTDIIKGITNVTSIYR